MNAAPQAARFRSIKYRPRGSCVNLGERRSARMRSLISRRAPRSHPAGEGAGARALASAAGRRQAPRRHSRATGGLEPLGGQQAAHAACCRSSAATNSSSVRGRARTSTDVRHGVGGGGAKGESLAPWPRRRRGRRGARVSPGCGGRGTRPIVGGSRRGRPGNRRPSRQARGSARGVRVWCLSDWALLGLETDGLVSRLTPLPDGP